MMFPMRLLTRSLTIAILGWLVGAGLSSCNRGHRPYACENGSCSCDYGDRCSIYCEAPPCSVTCDGNNPDCVGECGNGDCRCGSGSHCYLSCHSPPCHADCASNSTCEATCANGECVCGLGSDCSFDCLSGPCHVDCVGNNAHCAGVCANGSCKCGSGSQCRFTCQDDDCGITCEAGAHCILDCPSGNAGNGCQFDQCAAGAPTICPGGYAVTCDATCPVDSIKANSSTSSSSSTSTTIGGRR